MIIRKTNLALSTIISAATLVLGCVLLFENVYAENDLNMHVNVQDTLSVEVSPNPIRLTLNPLSDGFNTTSFTVTAGTNNADGYKLYMLTEDTDLSRNDTDGISAVIPTLDQKYSEPGFPVNRWGYKLSSETDYSPFKNTGTLVSSTTESASIVTTFDLAAKVDYEKPAGTYSTTFNFVILAGAPPIYIHEFTNSLCKLLASYGDFTVTDIRDSNDYTVRYINGNCWMT